MQANEKEEFLKKAGDVLNDQLREGRTYYQVRIKTNHGTQGGALYFVENGIECRWPYNENEDLEKEIKDLDDKIDKLDLDQLTRDLSPFSKYEFVFRKGAPVSFKAYTAADLVEDLEKKIREYEAKSDEKNGAFKCYEAIGHFQMQAGKLGMFSDATITRENLVLSLPLIDHDGIFDCLYTALDKKLESVYIKLEEGTFTMESRPAYPDLGLGELTHGSIELAPDYKQNKEARLEAIRLRHAVYNGIGKMDERPIYLSVGGFRSNNWPENSTTHISEMLRVIYTEDTTVLISDGLSDIYPVRKKLDQYNGIGAEFYLEFAGHIPFETVKDHFCLALVNSVSQIAIEHGDFKAFMEKHTTATIEFREENVELWCVQDNKSNKKIKTFFRDEQYEGDNFGTFLGMPSKTVPQSMKLNKEEVLLVGVKPFGCEWLTEDRLRSEDNDTKARTRQQMIEHFNNTGEGNTVPVTYNEGGDSRHPEKSGIVETPLIPKNLL
jgi:hypothetical protein